RHLYPDVDVCVICGLIGCVCAELDRPRLQCVHCNCKLTDRSSQWCEQCRDSNGNGLRRRNCSECGKEFSTGARLKVTCSVECSHAKRYRKAKERAQNCVVAWRRRCGRIGAIENRRTANAAESLFDVLAANRSWLNAEVKGACSTSGFDRVVNRGAGWETIQIKGIGRKDEKAAVHLKGSTKAYVDGDFDTLAVVDTSCGDVWLMPWAVVRNKRWWYPVGQWDAYKTHAMGYA
ncbi:hypothetical protein LCGC14_2414700, partial [marine sediment metagenome]